MLDFRRKTNRLPPQSYFGQNAYFLTLCTNDRKPLFCNPQLVKVLLTLLYQSCSTNFFQLYTYCFVPDHLHLILAGQANVSTLKSVIQVFKGQSATGARKLGIRNLWQKGFYDHVIRSGQSLDEAAWYILMNPVRAGLTKTAKDWPHSGSSVFEWKTQEPPLLPFSPPWKQLSSPPNQNLAR